MEEKLQGTEEVKEQQRVLAKKAQRKTAAAKVIFALLLVAAVVFGLSFSQGSENGSAQTSASSAVSSPANTTESESEEATYRTVIDSEGRSVSVPAFPQNVAVLDSFSSEVALMLGAGDQLYSVPGGTMSDELLQAIYPSLGNLEQAYGNQVNIEDLLSAKVDLALVKSSLSDAERVKLESVNIPYVVVSYSTLDEQLEALDLVAEVLGEATQERGEKLHEAYDAMISVVDEHTARIPEADILRVYHSINDALLTDSASSLGASWIARAGAISVSADESPTSGSDYTATIEVIYQWQPNAVICNVAATAQTIREDKQWQALNAVTSGNVYAIPIGATRWGQRGSVETPLAMVWLGCTLYPDVYADVDLKDLVVSYYGDCLGITVDDELYEKILSGEGIRSTGNGSGAGSGGK